MKTINKKQGFTILEVMISLFILLVSILLLVDVQRKMSINIMETRQRSQATWITNDLIERIRANRIGFSNPIEGYSKVVGQASNNMTAYCAITVKDCLTNTCTAIEIVDYDVNEIFCSNNELIDLEIEIFCIGNVCSQFDSRFTISTSWLLRDKFSLLSPNKKSIVKIKVDM